ncbi:MAG: leucine-rich repeat domain-containing protein [Clostridium sp.]|nr:leucine-rich repeat domain-containing protein [Clostridium sp.]
MTGIIICVFLFNASTLANAYEFSYSYQGHSITYTVIDEEAKTVGTKSYGSIPAVEKISGSVVIPSKVNDGDSEYTVISIGDYGFSGSSLLESIEFPNSIITIGHHAFCECNSLTDVIIPNSVTEVGVSAFADCSKLTNVVIGNSLTSISPYTFFNCVSLKSVKLGSSITSISYCAFKECYELKSIDFPYNLEHIEEYAFANCYELEEAILPNNFKTVDRSAFERCTNLKRVKFPETIVGIGDFAFACCSSLKTIYSYCKVPPGIGHMVFYDTAFDTIVYVPMGCLDNYRTRWDIFWDFREMNYNGVNEILFDRDASIEVFDCYGRKLKDENLAGGIYIVRRNGKAHKILVN